MEEYGGDIRRKTERRAAEAMQVFLLRKNDPCMCKYCHWPEHYPGEHLARESGWCYKESIALIEETIATHSKQQNDAITKRKILIAESMRWYQEEESVRQRHRNKMTTENTCQNCKATLFFDRGVWLCPNCDWR